MARRAEVHRKVSQGKRSGGSDISRRRREILDIAAECFAHSGYEVTSIREIGDRAGILSGSLYHHFKSKDDMLHELIRPHGEMLVNTYRQIAAQQGDAITVLTDLLRFNLRHILAGKDVQKIMYKERGFFRSSPDFAYVKGYYDEINAIFVAALNRAVVERAVDTTINTTVVEVFILRFIVSLIEPPGALDRIPPEDLEEEVLNFILRAVGAKAA